MRIAVLGLGLIGGSVALAARERLDARVSGYDPSPAARDAALARGAADEVSDRVAGAVADADAVFAAAPVGELSALVSDALQAAGPDTVVTDVGSTKRDVVAAHPDPRFVGGHPLAGAETAGIEHARADLFDGATWFLCPGPATEGILFERLHRLLHRLGAQPAAIDATTHDEVMAAVSHLPHVLANVLVAQAAATLSRAGERRVGGVGFGPSLRDATRVAGAPSPVWTPIYRANRDALLAQLDAVIDRLRDARGIIAGGDDDAITAWNDGAAADRRTLLETGLTGGALAELRVSVPNRPGVVAEIALALGRAGVDIADLALYPAPDMTEGVIGLWIAGDADADRAGALVSELGFPVVRA